MLNQKDRKRLNELSKQVISAAFDVGNELGGGFLEKVYENSLLYELQVRGLKAESQKPISVEYKGRIVGDYYADILVKDILLHELKCVDEIAEEHIAQCLNYLKATGFQLALLINFQKPKVEMKRVVRDF